MVIKRTKFTPEVLLSAPRRSAGIPSPSGRFAFSATSSYDFRTHKKSVSITVLQIETGKVTTLSNSHKIHDLTWLDDDTFIFLHDLDDGSTTIHLSNLSNVSPGGDILAPSKAIISIDAAAANLKVKALGDGEFALTLSAEALPDGSPYNAKKAPQTYSTGKLYTSLFVRHWDRYETKQKNSLWYGKFRIGQAGQLEASAKLINALHGHDINLESPIRPFGGLSDFDISEDRLIFVSRDPDSNPATTTKSNVYLLEIQSWESRPAHKPEPLLIDAYQGAKSSPTFSPDGRRAAFLAMRRNGNEADKNRIFIVSDVKVAAVDELEVASHRQNRPFWDLSPQSLIWASSGNALLAIIEEEGQGKVFYLPLDSTGRSKPTEITNHGTANSLIPVSNNSYFVSGSSFIDSSLYAIIEIRQDDDISIQHLWSQSFSGSGNFFGLHADQISSIWTPASNPKITKEVHSWVFKPSDFDESKTYPVAYLIHGGPQSAWQNSWSTRWNPAVFAEQGYIVISPNPTGSTGYGQRFVDAIIDNWGGSPYEDIVNVFDWVSENMPEADQSRAVALGASYGGYMMNWIQGQDLGRKFKALVCHDGSYSTASEVSTDELYFAFYNFGSTPWGEAYPPDQNSHGDASGWTKWDPSNHIANWSTPELVIHSSKDYRLPISEGLAAFNVLQARGVPSQFLTFPDENHWVLSPENSLVWHRVVLNWINQYSGLPLYSDQDPESDEFWGGVKHEPTCETTMPTQGDPAT